MPGASCEGPLASKTFRETDGGGRITIFVKRSHLIKALEGLMWMLSTLLFKRPEEPGGRGARQHIMNRKDLLVVVERESPVPLPKCRP